jgi:hypothetical protein
MAPDLIAAVSVAGRVCVGLVFVLAATQKAQHWRTLFGVIANYRLLPRGLVGPAAILLPPVEMALGLLLLSGQLRPFGELAAIGLLMLFAGAIAINLQRGRDHIDCGCGQSFLKQNLSWTLITRNVGLAVLLLPPLLPGASVAVMPAILTGVAAGLGLFLLYLIFNAFAALPFAGRVA